MFNNKYLSELDFNLQDFLKDIFENDEKIKAWKNRENQKTDIFIKYKNYLKNISLKCGNSNSAILLVFYNKKEDIEKINELHTKVAESNKRNNHNMMIRTINCIPGPSVSNL